MKESENGRRSGYHGERANESDHGGRENAAESHVSSVSSGRCHAQPLSFAVSLYPAADSSVFMEAYHAQRVRILRYRLVQPEGGRSQEVIDRFGLAHCVDVKNAMRWTA